MPAGSLFAQGLDNSGNHLLNGTYYFRHVLYGVSNQADANGFVGDITEAIAVYGNIVFDGAGNYTISSTNTNVLPDSGQGISGPAHLSHRHLHHFSQAASAIMTARSLRHAAKDNIFGLVSANGIFSGSSTEATSAYTDMFIAAQLPSPTPGNSFFTGSYTAAAFIPGGTPYNSEDASIQLTADGAGHLSTLNMTGYYGGGTQTTILTQSNNGLGYFFSNGAAVLTFPSSTTANFYAAGSGDSGKEYLYFSPDGNFFFGGSPDVGFDMIVGVRNPSGAQNFAGLYYNTGLYQDESQVSLGYAYLNGYYGSFNATTGGSVIQHQRISDPANSGAFGSTFADSFTPPVTGTYTNPAGFEEYTVGGGGAIRIGEGIWPYIGIDVGLQAPKFSGAAGAPYLDPTGIVNAASFAPFTAGVSDGEFLTLYGANLAPDTNVFTGAPFPTKLDGVQVTVNGTPAPIYYVTKGQLAIVAPFTDQSLPSGADPGQQQRRALEYGEPAGELNHARGVYGQQQRARLWRDRACGRVSGNSGEPGPTG